MDLVRGAGSIHFDVSPHTLALAFYEGKTGLFNSSTQRSAFRKEILAVGNVAKNGFGASVSILTPVNTTQNVFTSRSIVALTGKLNAMAGQDGQSVGVVVGSGSSSNVGFNGGILIESGAVNTTENVRLAGSSLRAASASFTATDKISQVDLSGAVQFTKAIGVGLSLIINDIKRKTRNRLDANGTFVLTDSDGLGLEALATNSGDILTIAVAGAVGSSATKEEQSNGDTISTWIPQISSFGVSAAGSVAVNKLDGDEVSSTLASNDGALVAISAPSVTLAAKDSTSVQNWGGAVAFGKRGAKTPDENGSVDNKGQTSIAGSANINFISRDVNSALGSIDLGSQPTSINLTSSTEGSQAIAGAISLSVAVAPGTNLAIPGSIALNLSGSSSPSPSTKATINNISGTAIKGLSAKAIEGADAGAYAGSLGLAANPLRPSQASWQQTGQTSENTQQGEVATFGFSIAINDLKAGSLAELSGSTLTTTAGAPITIQAKTKDVDLKTVSISAAGSASSSPTQTSPLGTYAIAGAGAGAENKYTSPITAKFAANTISAPASGSAASLTIEATSDEQVLAVTGGVDIAIARGNSQTTTESGAISVGASASHNTLSGGIAASISGDSTVTVQSLNLNSVDGSSIGAYAIAGAASGASGALGLSFSGALVGAGTGNVITRSLDARIGDPNASSINTGRITVGDSTIRALRSDKSRIVADAAGVAIAAALAKSTESGKSSKAISAGIAGAFSFNTISGGVTSGIFNINDFTATGNTTIESLAMRGVDDSNINTFSGGFAVSFNSSSSGSPGSGGSGGLGLGLVVANNTISDGLTAQIKNVTGGSDGTITVGTLAIRASNDRKINANAAGGALVISQSSNTSAALAIGAVDGTNKISGDVIAGVSLVAGKLTTTGNGIVLDDVATSLDILAADTAKIEAVSVAAAISMASGTTSLSLSGGGAGATNTVNSNPQAIASTATLSGTGTGRHRIRATTTKGSTTSRGDSRQIEATILAAAIAGSATEAPAGGGASSGGAAAIGVSTANNQIAWDSSNNRSSGTGVTAKLEVASANIVGGLELSSINADAIHSDVAAVAVGFAYGTTGESVAVSAAGAGATNRIGTNSAAQIIGRSSGAGELKAASLKLQTLDIGSIKSGVGAGSIAISYAGSGNLSVAPAIGAATATNNLDGNSDTTISGFTGITTTSGDLTLRTSRELLDTNNNSLAQRSIDSTAAAVAISLAIGSKLPVGVAGGGASAYNTILGDTSASIATPSITSAGNLSVKVNAAGSIDAKILAISAAGAGTGNGSAGAASVGVSISRNFIGASQGNPGVSGGSPSISNSGAGNRIKAVISGPAGNGLNTLNIAGVLAAEASHTATIEASVVAVSAAVASASSGTGLALSGAGSEATNVIATSTNATISGNSISGSTASLSSTNLTARATDSATIDATANGASLAASIGSSDLSVAPSIGVSLASNTISRNTKAELTNFSSVLPTGNVEVSSLNSGTISSKSIAAAISAAVGKGAFGLSGGGANSFNTITGTNQALITNASLGSVSTTWNGNISVTASDTSAITAMVDTITAAAAGGENGGAAAIGVALARNFIGETQGNSGLSGGSPQSFTNLLGGSGNLVRAAITDSNLYAKGAISVTASNAATIRSYVDSFAGALSVTTGPGSSGTLVGAGSEATNRSRVAIQAFLGATSGTTISLDTGALNVSSSDTTSADTTSWGAAVGVSFGGGVTGAAAIGVSLARTTLNNSTATSFQNIAAGSKAAALTLTSSKAKAANRSASVSTKSAAVAVAISSGSAAGAGALAGGGADAINTLLGDATTTITAANITVAGAVALGSSNSQTVDAGVGAGVGAGSFSGAGGAISIGAVKVQNLLGIASADASDSSRAKVQTTIADSSLITTGIGVSNPNLSASSSSTASYSALAVPVSVAITTGQFAGAFSGAFNDSRIAYDVQTTVSRSNLVAAGNLAITATTDNEISRVNTDAGSVAASFNPSAGGGIAIGAAENKNRIDNINKVNISDGANNANGTRYTIQSKGDLTINANDIRSSVTQSNATTTTVAGGIVAASGGGAGVYNTVANTIATTITGAIDINAGVIGDGAIESATIQPADTSVAQADQITLAGHYNYGDIIFINLGSGSFNDIVSYTVTNLTPASILSGLVAAINSQASSRYTAATVSSDPNSLTVTAKTANVSFVSDVGLNWTGLIASATARTANSTDSQINALTIGGTYNKDDVITIQLSSGSNVDVVSYTVTNPGLASIVSGLITAINTQANSRYIAAAVVANPNRLTITAKTTNLPFLAGGSVAIASQASVASAAFRAGSLTIGSASAATTLNSEIINTSVAAGLGAAVGVGVVENRVGNSVLTLTQSSAKTGGTNAPTFAASSNVTFASSSADNIAQTKVISVSASLFGAAVNSAKAINTTTSRSQVQAGSIYTPLGTTFIQSTSVNNLESASYGGALGAFAGLGLMFAESSLGSTAADAEVQALVGSGASITAKNIEITSLSRDSVYTDSVSAAGGYVGAGAGAQSKATTNQTVQTTIGSGATIKASGNLKLSSLLDQTGEDGNSGGIDSRGEGIAVSGGIAGGGADLTNEIFSRALLDVGSNSQLIATSIDLGAGNSLEKTRYSQPTGNGTSPNANVKVVVVPAVVPQPASATTLAPSVRRSASLLVPPFALPAVSPRRVPC